MAESFGKSLRIRPSGLNTGPSLNSRFGLSRPEPFVPMSSQSVVDTGTVSKPGLGSRLMGEFRDMSGFEQFSVGSQAGSAFMNQLNLQKAGELEAVLTERAGDTKRFLDDILFERRSKKKAFDAKEEVDKQVASAFIDFMKRFTSGQQTRRASVDKSASQISNIV